MLNSVILKKGSGYTENVKFNLEKNYILFIFYQAAMYIPYSQVYFQGVQKLCCYRERVQ